MDKVKVEIISKISLIEAINMLDLEFTMKEIEILIESLSVADKEDCLKFEPIESKFVEIGGVSNKEELSLSPKPSHNSKEKETYSSSGSRSGFSISKLDDKSLLILHKVQRLKDKSN